MVDRCDEFSFFQDIHVRIDISIDISISIRPMTIKFGKTGTSAGFDSNETNQTGAGDIITSRSCDKLKALYVLYQSVYSHQTWQDGNLS